MTQLSFGGHVPVRNLLSLFHELYSDRLTSEFQDGFDNVRILCILGYKTGHDA
jgi:hypothetical protein